MGLTWKVDEGTEEGTLGGPSDVEKLWRPDLPMTIWEVLEAYSDVFTSELPKDVPPVRMGHEFNIDLEDEIPHIHRPLYKLSPLELSHRILCRHSCSNVPKQYATCLPRLSSSQYLTKAAKTCETYTDLDACL